MLMIHVLEIVAELITPYYTDRTTIMQEKEDVFAWAWRNKSS